MSGFDCIANIDEANHQRQEWPISGLRPMLPLERIPHEVSNVDDCSRP